MFKKCQSFYAFFTGLALFLYLVFSAFSILLEKCLLFHKLFLSCCFVCFIVGKNVDVIVVWPVPSCRSLQLTKTGYSG